MNATGKAACHLLITIITGTAVVSLFASALIPSFRCSYGLRTLTKATGPREKDSRYPHSEIPAAILFALNNQFEEQDDVNQQRSITRRYVLQVALAASTFSVCRKSRAFEENGGIIENNHNGRVVLRTSTSNVPNKYEKTSMSKILEDSSPDSFKDVEQTQYGCRCESTEERRIRVFERAAPSVVFIDTYAVQRDAFSPNIMEVPLGAGSGFIWDDKGHIVTNYHVVRNAKSAQVAVLTRVFHDSEPTTEKPKSYFGGKSRSNVLAASSSNDGNVTDYVRSVYKAKVVGFDPDKDIAVLKIEAPVYDLNPIDVGASKGLKVGQEALAIGNPFGLDHTLTVGVISGTGREVRSPSGRPISNVIQTDASINPGECICSCNSSSSLTRLEIRLVLTRLYGRSVCFFSAFLGNS